MSRSGYTENCDNNWDLIKWRGQVASAIRGKRGQTFLRELVAALDAMPEKRLIAHELTASIVEVDPFGGGYVREGVCAIGSVGVARGITMEALDPDNYDQIADVFGIAHQLVQEIEFENDEDGDYYGKRTPEQRWAHMRAWAAGKLKEP